MLIIIPYITGADLGILRGGGGGFWAGILQGWVGGGLGSRSAGIFILTSKKNHEGGFKPLTNPPGSATA